MSFFNKTMALLVAKPPQDGSYNAYITNLGGLVMSKTAQLVVSASALARATDTEVDRTGSPLIRIRMIELYAYDNLMWPIEAGLRLLALQMNDDEGDDDYPAKFGMYEATKTLYDKHGGSMKLYFNLKHTNETMTGDYILHAAETAPKQVSITFCQRSDD
jgi:hypothetical protein